MHSLDWGVARALRPLDLQCDLQSQRTSMRKAEVDGPEFLRHEIKHTSVNQHLQSYRHHLSHPSPMLQAQHRSYQLWKLPGFAFEDTFLVVL